MAKLIEVISLEGGAVAPTFLKPLDVKTGTVSSIKVGYLVMEDGSNPGYYKAAPDTTDTDDTITGVANIDSTETAAADGVVDVVKGDRRLICRMKATTPGNLAITVIGTKCTLDVSAGDYTVDENDTTKGFIEILDYDNTTDGNCIVAIDCV